MGKVGVGFSDVERETWWTPVFRRPGIIIEVECMELTPAGRFRHPRFIRIREDKA